MTTGRGIARLSGFLCTECGAPLRYFALLSTLDNGRDAVECDACHARMRLADIPEDRKLLRWLLGLLPEIVLMIGVFFLIQWIFDADRLAADVAAGLVLTAVALFFPLILLCATVENRLNHRVEGAEPLYDEATDEQPEESV